MANGYCGRILRVDLTEGKITEQIPDQNLLRQYIGGTGLAVRLLYDETTAHTDPLGPDNVLAILTGPLAGTRVPASDRFAVAARSPLTGLWGEGDCGGKWASSLKRAGVDGVVVTGQAAKPVYLWVEDGQAELRDAQDLWGMDTYELDLGGQMICIGPAGEKLVRYAAIMSGGKDGRAAGRCGLGAVMGSKRLKAIVAKGSGKVPVYDDEALKASVKEWIPTIREGTAGMSENGTDNGLITFERLGGLAIKNWQLGSWPEGVETLTGAYMTKTILTGRYACGGCPIGCGRVVEVKEGPFAMPKSAGPEYETVGAFGTMCMIDDLKPIAKLNELCNRYGLDTIETGSIVAFVMEARERGLLDEGPTWGDAEGAVELVQRIGQRQDELAHLLGEGLRPAAEKLGPRALEFAPHIKGMALPMHDGRAYYGGALAFATSARGACHLQGFSHVFERGAVTMPEIGYAECPGRFEDEGKGELVAKTQDLMCLFDSFKACKFILFGRVKLTPLLEWFNQVTGWGLDVEGAMEIGERISNLKRMYNVRLGASRKDDWLPQRLLVQAKSDGGAAGRLPALGRMLADYYKHRGWDPMGIPSRGKLVALGLHDAAEDL
jgi:aldehyde:ferredoxin oxidoreductase